MIMMNEKVQNAISSINQVLFMEDSKTFVNSIEPVIDQIASGIFQEMESFASAKASVSALQTSLSSLKDRLQRDGRKDLIDKIDQATSPLIRAYENACITQCLFSKATEEDEHAVQEFMSGLSPSEREHAIAWVPLMKEKGLLQGLQRQDMLLCIKTVCQYSDPKSVIDDAVRLLVRILPLQDRLTVMEYINSISKEMRSSVIDLMCQLLAGQTRPQERIQILQVAMPLMRSLTKNEIDDYLVILKPLTGKFGIFKMLCGVPKEERGAFCALLNDVIKVSVLPTASAIQQFIEVMLGMTQEQRACYIRTTCMLLESASLTSEDAFAVFSTISRVGIENWSDDDIILIKQIIDQDTQAFDINRYITTLASVSATDRAEVLRYMLVMSDSAITRSDTIAFMQEILQAASQDREHVLAKWVKLQQATPVDRHHHYKDKAVLEDCDKVMASQPPLSVADSVEICEDLTSYLQAPPNSLRKTRALTALISPDMVDAQGKLIKVDALILPCDGIEWPCHGLNQFIACLWRFANGLAEPERTNAREGMISALATCNSQGHPICRLGLQQELLLQVVQGRIPNIKIDALVIDDQEKIIEATKIFFELNNQCNRLIENWTELMQAGEAFCQEHPSVIKKSFLWHLAQYAYGADILQEK